MTCSSSSKLALREGWTSVPSAARRCVGAVLADQRRPVELADVELDRRGELQQRPVLVVELEVVERELEAGVDRILKRLQQLAVDLLAADQLEHDALGRQRQRPHLEQELARDVDVGALGADQPL
jgi:hypothetical protein